MLEPDLIAPGEFAGEKQSLRGEVFLHELDERVWSHEYFADKDSPLHVVLQGGIDRFQRPFLDLKVLFVLNNCLLQFKALNQNKY